MTEEAWLPLGIETHDEIATYDALHEGVPEWMEASFWVWISNTISFQFRDRFDTFPMLNVKLFNELAQTLQISVPTLVTWEYSKYAGQKLISSAIASYRNFDRPLQIADYLVAHKTEINSGELDALLKRCKSLYEVGERHGRPGLVRRVPLGVKVNADAVMQRSGNAGVKLAQAWAALYGIEPDPSKAYLQAIKAVEDAAIPLVCPTNGRATLGTLIRQMEDQGGWNLPLAREVENSSSAATLLSMMRLLWHGQHDRHGGQPSVSDSVSFYEAEVAVSLAAALVHLFSANLISRT